MTRNIRTTRTPASNSGLAIVSVQYSEEIFAVNESSVLRISFNGRIRHHLKSATRKQWIHQYFLSQQRNIKWIIYNY